MLATDALLNPLAVCGLCLCGCLAAGATNPRPPPSPPPPCGGMFITVGTPPEPSVPDVAPPTAFPNCAEFPLKSISALNTTFHTPPTL